MSSAPKVVESPIELATFWVLGNVHMSWSLDGKRLFHALARSIYCWVPMKMPTVEGPKSGNVWQSSGFTAETTFLKGKPYRVCLKMGYGPLP